MSKKLKNKRSKKLINYNYQLRTIISTLFCASLFSLLILLLVYKNTFNLNSFLETTEKDLNNALKTEAGIIETCIKCSESDISNNQIKNINKIKIKHKNAQINIKSYIKKIKPFHKDFIYVVYIAIILIIIQLLIIMKLLVNFTHKFTGPALVICRKLDKLLNNEKLSKRSLRKNDELHEIVEKIKLLS